jgi:hypothetical protein
VLGNARLLPAAAASSMTGIHISVDLGSVKARLDDIA